ncbi:MAG: SDR family oxidoreductase [Pseudomonadota bacterium]
MKLNDKTVIVTGAARGIGAAIATRFAQEGAKVVVSDLNEDQAIATAEQFGGLGAACDVTDEAQIKALVEKTESHFGPVDLFCSNAGLYKGEPDHAASAPNEDWQLCWDVHVMAHVYAARAVLPSMIERGEGYFVQVASAAGLLAQIGDAAYSATKHAAVSFAESLAISHGDQGIKVSAVCPQYIATELLGYSEADGAKAASEHEVLKTPQELAESVVKGVEEETFLILPHAEVEQYIQFKAGNYDKWIGAMRKLRAKALASGGLRMEDMLKVM